MITFKFEHVLTGKVFEIEAHSMRRAMWLLLDKNKDIITCISQLKFLELRC